MVHIKSFVVRNGRITLAQQKALNELLAVYGIRYANEYLDLPLCFGRKNPKIMEIGFGMGVATALIARNNPDKDYIAVEVHKPGVGSLLRAIAAYELNNLKIIVYDAVEVLHNMIIDKQLSGVNIFFPDPWTKRKHHKRRLIQEHFIKLLCDKLISGGYIHIATDCEDYAFYMLSTLSRIDGLRNCATSGAFIERTDALRPLTKFEQRGLTLGHKVWDIFFVSV